MSPFPFINELYDLEEITGINDLLRIMNFVYGLIPWTKIPYEKSFNFNEIELIYDRFKKLEIGGWCGLNAEFFKWIIEGYRHKNPSGIRYRSYNYGLQKQQITHINVVVEIDELEFLFDPYFNRYYIHKDGFPLQLKNLLYFIRERKIEKYKTVFLKEKKPIIQGGSVYYLSPQEFLKEILESFESNDYSRVMKDIFGSTNPDLLMLLKIPN